MQDRMEPPKNCPFHTPVSFRCPFEKEGERKKSIIEVALSDDRQERIEAAIKAFETFHRSPDSPGIRFILPPSLLASVNSLADLKLPLLPFQTEILAAELEHRLYPFLPQHQPQFVGLGMEKARELFMAKLYKVECVQFLLKFLQSCGVDYPRASDVASCLEGFIKENLARGVKCPSLMIFNHGTQGELYRVMRISASMVTIFAEQGQDPANPDNQNCFCIIKTPFYPETFGRYSNNIEIIMSRERDFVGLSRDVRRSIRTNSNTVLREAGIHIVDLAEDKPEGEGLWIP